LKPPSRERKSTSSSNGRDFRCHTLAGCVAIFAGIHLEKKIMLEFTLRQLGWSAAALLPIPVALLVRLLSRRSRWSVLRVTVVSVIGVAAAALWLSCLEGTAHMEAGALGGALGTRLSASLEVIMGDRLLAVLSANALFFLWLTASLMDAIIATARFFINKPYVREVVKERVVTKVVETPAGNAAKRTKANEKPRKPASSSRGKPSGETPARRRAEGPDELPSFRMPPLSILRERSAEERGVPQSEIDRNISVIRETLADHHVEVADIDAVPGPTVTLYKVYPAKGVKVSTVRGLAEDVSVALKAESVMASTLKDCIGFEVANRERSSVPMRELLESDAFRSSGAELPVAIGKTITGDVKVFDLAAAPHLLVAGATMQGKSVGLNVIVASLLYAKRPSELKFVFIDPKKTEFNYYARLLRHYLAVIPDASSEEDEKARAIVKKPGDADMTLRSLCEEMDQRYSLLEQAGTPKLQEYLDKWNAHKLNPEKGHRFLPYLVVIIDEYSQLVLGVGGQDAKAHARSIMTSIISLAQMGRACGIHLVIATQTPRREVISGMIKANFPMSIAFKTKTPQDSQVIIDQSGAQDLVGKGDMLLSFNASIERIQCGLVTSREIDAVTGAIESQKGHGMVYSTPYYLPEVKEDEGRGAGGGSADMGALDERFEEAARLVVSSGQASTSDLQRRLGMGYAKAGRVMDQLEAAGVVGPQNGSRKREVLVGSPAELDSILEACKKKQ